MLNHKRAIAAAVMAAMGLTACGGGTVGGDSAPATDGKATGVITGFGSVYVNGIEYETAGARYTLDDNPGSGDADLAVGMVVTVTGRVNADGSTGTATAIEFRDEVEGVVTANGLAGGGDLEVMGQTVAVTATTRFESAVAGQSAPADIVPGNIVEVSGYSDANGHIVATRIEVKAADIAGYGEDGLEVKGVLRNVDPNLKTFTVGQLTVDYSEATYGDMPALEGDWDGVYAEVKTVQGLVDGVMLASKVEPEGSGELGFDGDDGDEVEVRGLITSVESVSEFTLNGRPVRIVAGGDHAVTLVAGDEGRYVKAEGQLDAAGTLLAREVEFEHADDTGLKGRVEGEPANGTLVLLGRTVRVTSTTLLADDRDAAGVPREFYFDLTDLHSGDRVEVEGYTDSASGELVAVSLTREDDDDNDEVDGAVESVGTGTFVVAGVTVAWAGALPAPGAELEVDGSYDAGSGVFTATGVELDD
jgi:hypothetical protein